MRSLVSKSFTAAVVFAVAVILGAEVYTQVKHRQEVDPISNEQKLARTLGIIHSSTPTDRKVLKVLFYGQSITRSGWVDTTIAHWREKYPNTIFVIQNRALGGFAAQALVRTTEQDIRAFYPDLIVFHVYGDHHAYEKIIRDFRSETAADIIVQTDHAEVLPDPPCVEGLQLSLHRAPGCKGFLWVKQREWSDEMSYHTIPAYAKKYSLAIEPQRGWWRDYLLRTHIDPRSMLRDAIHPNDKGKALYAQFFDDYFDDLVAHYTGQRGLNPGDVVSLPANPSQHTDGNQTIYFDGSRLELISSKPLSTYPAVTIDGVAPKDIDSCYLVSRTTPTPTVPDWPAIRKITLIHDRVSADWTATLNPISADQKSFSFSIRSFVPGQPPIEQGSGDSAHDFTASSSLLKIEADDWMIERAYEESKKAITGPFEVKWSVTDQCGGQPEVIDRTNGREHGSREYRYVLGTGLDNKPHTIELRSPPVNLANVIEFRAYKPPLK